MTTENFTTLHVWDTTYSADSVEWCPISPYQFMFVCGTYHLVKDCDEYKEIEGHQKRLGTILLFSFSKGELKLCDQTETPAILDLKWSPKEVRNQILLGSVDSLGNISVFTLEEDKLKFLTKLCLKKDKGDFILLSLDWSKQVSDDGCRICVSDCQGNVILLKFGNSELVIEHEWNAHSLEAWIVHLDAFNENLIYSGGDDAKLRLWDVREGSMTPKVTSSRHTSGVTAIHSTLAKENFLASGSYDENLFFWDTRSWKQPVEKILTSGGVWRIKWEPKSECRYLLAACIYGGFQVVDSYVNKVVGEYKEHDSLAYGADWCFLTEENTTVDCGAIIATCSFYDHKLCVSVWDKNKVID